MRIKLDAQLAQTVRCKPGKKKTDYWDTIISGFLIEARASGGATYALRYIDQHRRQRQVRIGAVGEITFEQARKKAQRLRSEVVLGGDPAGDKQAVRAVPTYAELAKMHLDHAKTYQRSYETTEGYMRVHILPKWGKKWLTEINRRDVAAWLAEKTDEGLAPATVEKLRVILGRSFELATQWDMPGVTKNPARGIKRPPINNARNRSLNASEVQRLMAATRQSRNTQLPHIVGLLLLTGARVSELLKAEWKHVDLERRLWLIPTSKSGKPRHVPLSQQAIEIIEQLPRFDKCPYLIPNPETRQPFGDIKHAWQRARDIAYLPDLRIHDLRHAAASSMVSAGVSLYAVGSILGHASHASTARTRTWRPTPFRQR